MRNESRKHNTVGKEYNSWNEAIHGGANLRSEKEGRKGREELLGKDALRGKPVKILCLTR